MNATASLVVALGFASTGHAQEWWPPELDLGAVVAGQLAEGEAWILNTGEVPLDLAGIHAESPQLELGLPLNGMLLPGRARRVSWAGSDPGTDGTPTLRIEVVDPRELAVERFFSARRCDDEEASDTAWAEDARLWFDEREGEGMLRNPDGGGPWSAWDAELFKVLVVDSISVTDESVDVAVRERNDYHRLLDRSSRPYVLRYWFDEELRITGRLVTALEPRSPSSTDRFEEFRIWAESERPDQLAALWPGKIVPSAENAVRFRVLLIDWRAAAGLPDILRTRR